MEALREVAIERGFVIDHKGDGVLGLAVRPFAGGFHHLLVCADDLLNLFGVEEAAVDVHPVVLQPS